MTRNPLNDEDISGNTLNLNPVESSKEEYYNKHALRHKDYRFTDFEDYLMTAFAEGDGSIVLDDEFPDAFDSWLCDLESDDFIRYGNIYARICVDKKIDSLSK